LKINNELLNQAENHIRVGQTTEAHELALSLLSKVGSLSPFERIKLGNIFRRVGDFTATSRLLYKLARSEEATKKIRDSASLEYGTALIFLGLLEEGMELLRNLDIKTYPLALMNMALGHQQEWDYDAAVPLLEKFVMSESIDSYQRLVGEVNLQISYLSSNPSMLTWNRVQELGNMITSQKLTLLSGVFTQIEGRFLSSQQRFEEARAIFQKGLAQLQGVATFDRVRLQKWFLINEFENDHKQKPLLAQWQKLKAQSLQLHDSETLRECDRYLGYYSEHSELLNYCYHGTPYLAYQRYFSLDQVESFIDLEFNTKGEQVLLKSSDEVLLLDKLDAPFTRSSKKILPTGSSLQLILTAMTIDFYRPMTLPRLFHYAYPGQYWNPLTSPVQVRQGLFRLRQWLKSSGYNLKIYENNSKYFLAANKKSQSVRIGPNKLTMEQKIEQKLKAQFGDTSFRFEDFNSLSEESTTTMQRHLAELLKKGIIQKEGNTRSARFKLTHHQST